MSKRNSFKASSSSSAAAASAEKKQRQEPSVPKTLAEAQALVDKLKPSVASIKQQQLYKFCDMCRYRDYLRDCINDELSLMETPWSHEYFLNAVTNAGAIGEDEEGAQEAASSADADDKVADAMLRLFHLVLMGYHQMQRLFRNAPEYSEVFERIHQLQLQGEDLRTEMRGALNVHPCLVRHEIDVVLGSHGDGVVNIVFSYVDLGSIIVPPFVPRLMRPHLDEMRSILMSQSQTLQALDAATKTTRRSVDDHLRVRAGTIFATIASEMVASMPVLDQLRPAASSVDHFTDGIITSKPRSRCRHTPSQVDRLESLMDAAVDEAQRLEALGFKVSL